MGDANDASHVHAVSRADGSKLWEAKVGRAGEGGGYPGSRSTPTVDGDRVYALGPHGDLVCLTLADGKELWKVSLTRDYKGAGGGWQYSESVLVDGNKVVCTPGGKVATMLALDKRTGKDVWKGVTPAGEEAGYSSIMVSTAGGTRQYVTLTSNAVVSFAADSGKLLWRYGNTDQRFAGNTANIPTVVMTADPNRIFATAGYNRGGGLVRLESAGGTIKAQEVYWSDKLRNKLGGVVRVGDYLFGDQDSSGRLWCADARTGNVMWTRKDDSGGAGSASLCYADGMLYVRFDNGYVSLIESTPKAYKLVSTFRVPNGRGQCWAYPAVIGGKLYIREKDVIWCYDVKGK
jgi:outer membrane protein assembly factor BamB